MYNFPKNIFNTYKLEEKFENWKYSIIYIDRDYDFSEDRMSEFVWYIWENKEEQQEKMKKFLNEELKIFF